MYPPDHLIAPQASGTQLQDISAAGNMVGSQAQREGGRLSPVPRRCAGWWCSRSDPAAPPRAGVPGAPYLRRGSAREGGCPTKRRTCGGARDRLAWTSFSAARWVRRGASGVADQNAAPTNRGWRDGRSGRRRGCIDRAGGPSPLLQLAPARTGISKCAEAMSSSWGSSGAPSSIALARRRDSRMRVGDIGSAWRACVGICVHEMDGARRMARWSIPLSRHSSGPLTPRYRSVWESPHRRRSWTFSCARAGFER